MYILEITTYFSLLDLNSKPSAHKKNYMIDTQKFGNSLYKNKAKILGSVISRRKNCAHIHLNLI